MRTNDGIAKLALEDGTVYTGRAFGASGETFGEVVFNTSMTLALELFNEASFGERPPVNFTQRLASVCRR